MQYISTYINMGGCKKDLCKSTVSLPRWPGFSSLLGGQERALTFLYNTINEQMESQAAPANFSGCHLTQSM